jgi:hypothetical protein
MVLVTDKIEVVFRILASTVIVVPEIAKVGLETSFVPLGVVYEVGQLGVVLQPVEYLQAGSEIVAVIDSP